MSTPQSNAPTQPITVRIEKEPVSPWRRSWGAVQSAVGVLGGITGIITFIRSNISGSTLPTYSWIPLPVGHKLTLKQADQLVAICRVRVDAVADNGVICGGKGFTPLGRKKSFSVVHASRDANISTTQATSCMLIPENDITGIANVILEIAPETELLEENGRHVLPMTFISPGEAKCDLRVMAGKPEMDLSFCTVVVSRAIRSFHGESVLDDPV